MKTEEIHMADAFPCTYLTFLLGGRIFGFEARSLWEISLAAAFSPLPPSAPFVAGITHLHGKIIPVLDLAKLLELASPEPHLARGFIAVKPSGWGSPSGFFSEGVLGFERYSDSELHSQAPSPEPSFRKGRVGTPERVVELLDMEKILARLKPASPAGFLPEIASIKENPNV